MVRETLIQSARTVSERFFGQSRYRKRRNTVCISRFRYRRVGGKDPLTVADDLIRGSQAKTPSIPTDRGRKIRGTTSNSAFSHEKCPHGVQQRLSLYRANPVLPYFCVSNFRKATPGGISVLFPTALHQPAALWGRQKPLLTFLRHI